MKMKIQEYIASQLRSYRAKYGLSLQELSAKSNVSIDTLSRYERAAVSANIEILEKILDFYGIDFCIFFEERYAKTQN